MRTEDRQTQREINIALLLFASFSFSLSQLLYKESEARSEEKRVGASLSLEMENIKKVGSW